MATSMRLYLCVSVWSRSDQVSITGSSGNKTRGTCGNQSPEMCVKQTPPPQHQMPSPQPHCWGLTASSAHQVVGVGSCWEVLHCCSHTEGAGHKQRHAISARRALPCTPLPLHTLFSCYQSVSPCGHLGRGIRNFLPSGNPAQAITSQHHQLSQTLGHSSTWKRARGTGRQACPSTEGWGNCFGFKCPHHGKSPQPLDSEFIRRETSACSPHCSQAGWCLRELLCVTQSCSCSHGYTRCLQYIKGERAGRKLLSAAAVFHGRKMVALPRNLPHFSRLL